MTLLNTELYMGSTASTCKVWAMLTTRITVVQPFTSSQYLLVGSHNLLVNLDYIWCRSVTFKGVICKFEKDPINISGTFPIYPYSTFGPTCHTRSKMFTPFIQ